MKKSEIKVGGLYLAKVSGKVVTVRVDAIRKGVHMTGGREMDCYDVTNLTTGRKTVFQSAAKFRMEVSKKLPNVDAQTDGANDMIEQSDLERATTIHEDEQPSDRRQAIEKLKAEFRRLEAEDTIHTPRRKAKNVHQPFGFCALCRELWIDRHGTIKYNDAAEHVRICKEAGCEHPPIYGDVQEDEQRSDPTKAVGIGTSRRSVDTLIDKLAAISLSEAVPVSSGIPATIAGYTPNAEQRAILEAVMGMLNSDGRVLVIEAGAGAGKTSQLRMIEELLKHLRGQYTAFNRPIVDESKGKFCHARCNTTHSLAFSPCGKDYAHRLGGARVRGSEIAAMLGLADYEVTGTDGKPKTLEAGYLAGQVVQALRRFSQTADRELTVKHFAYIDGIDHPNTYDNNDVLKSYLLPFAQKAWADVMKKDGTFPFTHDYYVKVWQLSANPVIQADYIMLDEDQDTAPVFADILQRQTQAMLILVGDENQAIYEWRGAVNATKLFPDAPVLYLSQSYRFGQTVADVANSILATLEERTKLTMKGLPDKPSRILMPRKDARLVGRGDDDEEDEDMEGGGNGDATTGRGSEYIGKVCYLYRTNAGAVGKILTEYAGGKRGCLIGNITEVLSFVEGADALQRGKSTSNPELAVFTSWMEVQKYVAEDPSGGDLELMVRLVDTFGCKAILEALKTMPKEEYADFVCSTAHKSKGREWDTVVLGSDFPPTCKMDDAARRLLYVAATRAKLVLDLTICTPFLPYVDMEGHRSEGIKINLTVPNPSKEDVLVYMDSKQGAKPVTVLSVNSPRSEVFTDQERLERAARINGQTTSTPATATYTKLKDGSWGIRSTLAIKAGDRVTVTKKNGTTNTATVHRVVWEGAGVWLASIV